MTRCGDCKHFERARNPKTGRVLPSVLIGECTYPVVWPELPKSFDPLFYGWAKTIQYPRRNPVSIDNKSECKMFDAKHEKPKRQVQPVPTFRADEISVGDLMDNG